MEEFLDILHKSIFSGLVSVFFFESILLFVRGKNNKARKAMGFALLIWAISYLIVYIRMFVAELPKYDTIYRGHIEILGNFYIVFVYLFPLQVLAPDWLNWKRALCFLLPIVLITVTYYAGMAILGETYEDIYTYRQLKESLGHFNVWYRFVILATNIIYMILVNRWFYKKENRYIQWINENFSDQENIDISWMRIYDTLIIILFVIFVGALVCGGRIGVIIHALLHIIAFSYLFYKALFYESPFKKEDIYMISQNKKKEITDNELSFENQLECYADIVRKWMDEEKPYLFKDLKLTDVSRVLPLNRSYLSRVFNEGFGKNFSEVVRFYRIEYAKQILKKNRNMPVYEVAELCGFSSDSTFNRAFKQLTGITPNQFKYQSEH